MPGPETAQTATSAPSGFWGFAGTAVTALVAWAGHQAWSKRPKRAKPVTHADLDALTTLVQDLTDKVDALRSGQDARGEQMAVLEASVASKEDLGRAVLSLTHEIQGVLASATAMMLKHLENHPQKAA